MAEILVKVQTYTHTDPSKDLSGIYKRGDVVDIRPDGFQWGNEERLPKFILVRVPGLDLETIKSRIYESWWHRIEYTIVSQDLATDTYTLDASAETQYVKADGTNALTRDRVESYLSRWNATVLSISANTVRFSASIYAAIRSQGFWGVDVTGVTFTEQNYNQTTGIHRVRAQYPTAWDRTEVEGTVTLHGGTIVASTNGNIRFDISRNLIFEQFKDDVKSKVDRIYVRRRYHFSDTDVQYAIDHGGVITLTPTQLSSHILDKIAE